jgi:hypothetical protein
MTTRDETDCHVFCRHTLVVMMMMVLLMTHNDDGNDDTKQ